MMAGGPEKRRLAQAKRRAWLNFYEKKQQRLKDRDEQRENFLKDYQIKQDVKQLVNDIVEKLSINDN